MGAWNRCYAYEVSRDILHRLGLAGFGSLTRGIDSSLHFVTIMLVPVGQYICVVTDVLIVASLQINLS